MTGSNRSGQEAVQSHVRFPAQAACENSEMMVLAEPVEKTIRSKPLFAENQPLSIAVKELLEVIDHFVVGRGLALFVDHPRGEFPVVIPAAAILPVLDLFARGLVAGEVLYSRLDGGAIGLGDVDEHAIHVEYEEVLHQIRSSSSRTRCACSRVPAVMRTPPGIS